MSLPGYFNVIAMDAVDGTNQEAKRLAADGAPDGTLVWALEQTAGKGRRGRRWVSEKGNLYFSLLLRPDYSTVEATRLSFVTANSVADALASALPRGTRVACKWPNDILVEGRKAAGLLLESASSTGETPDWVVIGIGVNLASHPADTDFPATSLAAEGAPEVTPEAMRDVICLRFLSWVATWRSLGFAPVRQAWLERAHGLGQPVTANLGGETVEGIFHTLDADGALVLRQNGDERRISAGDVFFSD